jgi:hypothetical protein
MFLTQYNFKKIPISKIRSYSRISSERDVERLRDHWERLKATRRRDGIYEFLDAVFELVYLWKVEHKDDDRSEQAFERFADRSVSLHSEPFAIMVATAASPDKIDRRTLSKFSRVLRLAAEFKAPGEPLKDFVKRKGGLNACAREFARRLGRHRKKRRN